MRCGAGGVPAWQYKRRCRDPGKRGRQQHRIGSAQERRGQAGKGADLPGPVMVAAVVVVMAAAMAIAMVIGRGDHHGRRGRGAIGAGDDRDPAGIDRRHVTGRD
jgi:hypothetical protein